MADYMKVSDIIPGASKTNLILLGYKTGRDRIFPYRVKMACVYQWADFSVLLIMSGSEPQVTLSKMMTAAGRLEGVTIGIRFPVTWYIRKALWDENWAHAFNHVVYVYGSAQAWEKSNPLWD